jgi:hypothetical protein
MFRKLLRWSSEFASVVDTANDPSGYTRMADVVRREAKLADHPLVWQLMERFIEEVERLLENAKRGPKERNSTSSSISSGIKGERNSSSRTRWAC